MEVAVNTKQAQSNRAMQTLPVPPSDVPQVLITPATSSPNLSPPVIDTFRLSYSRLGVGALDARLSISKQKSDNHLSVSNQRDMRYSISHQRNISPSARPSGSASGPLPFSSPAALEQVQSLPAPEQTGHQFSGGNFDHVTEAEEFQMETLQSTQSYRAPVFHPYIPSNRQSRDNYQHTEVATNTQDAIISSSPSLSYKITAAQKLRSSNGKPCGFSLQYSRNSSKAVKTDVFLVQN